MTNLYQFLALTAIAMGDYDLATDYIAEEDYLVEEGSKMENRAWRRRNLKQFNASRPAVLSFNEAIKKGVDSPEWNRYLASLPEHERRSTIKMMRDNSWMDQHLAYAPSRSSFPRYRGQTGSIDHEKKVAV